MIELSNERVEQILHEETPKTEDLATILRAIYIRHLHLYESIFADIDALNDDKIAELKEYHEETRRLGKYYYLDIPQDICLQIEDFDREYSAKLLGPDWHRIIIDSYEYFRAQSMSDKSEECLKAEFGEHILSSFYDSMDSILREGFGTDSQAAGEVMEGLSGLLFGGK